MEKRVKPKRADQLLGKKPVVVNIGLPTFAEALAKQGVEVITVRWSPPRQLAPDIKELLSHLL